MHRLLTIFIYCCLLGALPRVWSQKPHFISHDNPPGGIPNCLLQDDQGFIWAGTPQGLFQYDGRKWNSYLQPDSLGSQFVTALAEDKKGLWVGYEDGQLFRLNQDRTWQDFEPEAGAPEVAITDMVIEPEGRLWFSTYGEGLYYVENSRLYNINMDDGLPDDELYTLTLDTHGKIWTGSDGGLSQCWIEGREKKIKNFGLEEGLPDYIVQELQWEDDQHLLIGMYDHGFCKLDIVKDSFILLPSIENWNLGPVNTMVRVEDEIWIGTSGKGTWRFDGKNLEALDAHSRARVAEMMADNQGNLWVVDNVDGIRSAQHRFGFLEGVNGNVQACHAGRTKLWFSTQEGLYSFDRLSHKIEAHTLPLDLNIISLFEDEQGNVWIGDFGRGVYHLNPSTGDGQLFGEAEGLINGNVMDITGNDSLIWFATLGGASRLRYPAPVTFENFNREDHPALSYLYQIYLDKAGNTWFASDGLGLISLQEGAFVQHESWKDLTVFSIIGDAMDDLYFASAEKGLFHLEGEELQTFGLEEGMADMQIAGLALNGQGQLLIPHPHGLDLFQPEEGHFTFLGSEIGLEAINPDLNSLCKDAEGNIWLGTQKGLLRCKPGTTVYVNKPQTRMVEATAFLETLHEENPQLAYDQNSLSFEFTGLWYQAAEDISYQYRLQGFAPQWTESRDPQIRFPRLPPGSYTFEVRSALGKAFSQAETLSFPFVIHPPFWRRWWFLFSMMLILAGLAYLFQQQRERRWKEKERLEREKVEFQFETLKTQVNPHFLFNSFNTLALLIEEDGPEAVDYVEKLSDFYRNLLEFRSRTLISLEEELSLLEAYYGLQKKRYGDNLELALNLGEEEKIGKLVPMSLQMLVENAVKHNVVSRSQPLRIDIQRQGDYLVISNPIQAKRRAEPSTGLGLQNITSRYLLLGKKAVHIEQKKGLFVVSIPIL